MCQKLGAHVELDRVSKATERLGLARETNDVKGSRILCMPAFDILKPITPLQGKVFWKHTRKLLNVCAHSHASRRE